MHGPELIQPLCTFLDPQSEDARLQVLLLATLRNLLFSSEAQEGEALAIIRASGVRDKAEQLAQSDDEELERFANELLCAIDAHIECADTSDRDQAIPQSAQPAHGCISQ